MKKTVLVVVDGSVLCQMSSESKTKFFNELQNLSNDLDFSVEISLMTGGSLEYFKTLCDVVKSNNPIFDQMLTYSAIDGKIVNKNADIKKSLWNERHFLVDKMDLLTEVLSYYGADELASILYLGDEVQDLSVAKLLPRLKNIEYGTFFAMLNKKMIDLGIAYNYNNNSTLVFEVLNEYKNFLKAKIDSFNTQKN